MTEPGGGSRDPDPAGNVVDVRAQLVLARELVMAHLTEITLDAPGEASSALQSFQLADLTLTLTMAATGITHEALVAWAEDTGRPVEDVLSDLALRVAAKH
jgi:hypothetical protein